MQNFKRSILAYIREHDMIAPGDVVCVACSGGADSICLLTVLHELCEEGEISCTLAACHLNHNLRGAESDGDQAFVESYCGKLKIPLFCRSEKVRERSGGLEEAGRAAREELFHDCVQNHGVTKIALAHHMDDQAETVLFHLAHGAGLTGMSGMLPVRGDRIRPLLCVRRDEIEAWLSEQGISWRTDQSNASESYTRNRIRHNILPLLEQTVHGQAVRHIAEAAETMRLADRWIAGEAGKILPPVNYDREAFNSSGTAQVRRHMLLDEEIFREAEILRRYIILAAMEKLSGSSDGFSRVHVLKVLDLFAGHAGREARLANGIHAVREYGGVRLCLVRKEPPGLPGREAEGISQMAVPQMDNDTGTQKDGMPKNSDAACVGAFSVSPSPGRKQEIRCLGYRFEFEETCIYPNPIPQKPYTKWLNCDNIKNSLAIRTRRPGDYLVINEAGERQSVKAWMINHKIPRAERDKIPLLASGSEVFWIVGGRISARAYVRDDTKQVLYITAQAEEGAEHERAYQSSSGRTDS